MTASLNRALRVPATVRKEHSHPRRVPEEWVARQTDAVCTLSFPRLLTERC